MGMQVSGWGYYYNAATPRSNAGGRAGVCENSSGSGLASKRERYSWGEGVYHPPTPHMRTPHIHAQAGRHDDPSHTRHGTTCATDASSDKATRPAGQADMSASDKPPCRGTTCASPAF